MIDFGAVDDGFHEVLAIVDSAERSAERMCDAWGFSRLWQGPAEAGALALLGLEPREAKEILIGDPVQARGYLRLLEFPGLDNGVMRDGAQPWDYGGIQDFDVRALVPIERLHAATCRAGFCASAPITQFVFSGMTVKEVVSRDSDGVSVAIIERIDPPLDGFEHVSAPSSYLFNSTQTVPSFEQARAFYVEALGWKVVIESAWAHPDGGLNCIGLPLDVARERLLKVGIYHPKGENNGSIEILEVVGENRDYTAAAPPDRGLASLRLHVADVADFLARAERGGCAIVPPRAFTLQPYGPMLAGAAVTPWGVRLEAYQAASRPRQPV